MKLPTFLAHVTLLTGVAFVLSLTLNIHPLALLSLSITATFLAIAAEDYTRATRFAPVRTRSRPSGPPPSRNEYNLPFAA